MISLFLFFLSEVGYSLPTSKLLRYDIRMTTAVDCHGRLGSLKSVNQDTMDVSVDLDRLSFRFSFTYGGQCR